MKNRHKSYPKTHLCNKYNYGKEQRRIKDNLSAYSSDDHDKQIGSVLPYYMEFNIQILDLVRALGIDGIKWLNTGCGTGGLAQKALEIFPHAEFTLCDPSENMINAAKQKLNNYDIRYFNLPTQELSFTKEFDIVTAIQAHHYLDTESRKIAALRCYKALKKGGIYVSLENIALSSTQSESIGVKRWENFQRDNGRTDKEIKAHMSRRGTEVFPVKIEEHINLLKACGFKSADILWASYIQAVLYLCSPIFLLFFVYSGADFGYVKSNICNSFYFPLSKTYRYKSSRVGVTVCVL